MVTLRIKAAPKKMTDEEMETLLSSLKKFESQLKGAKSLSGVGHKILDKCAEIGRLGEE
jgi:hypothetical protein